MGPELTEETPAKWRCPEDSQMPLGRMRGAAESSLDAHPSCSSGHGFPPLAPVFVTSPPRGFPLVILVTHFWTVKYPSPFVQPLPAPALCSLPKILPYWSLHHKALLMNV